VQINSTAQSIGRSSLNCFAHCAEPITNYVDLLDGSIKIHVKSYRFQTFLPMSEWRCIMRIKRTNFKNILASNKKDKTIEHMVLELPTQFEANDPLPDYFDDMGKGTARILINRRLNERLLKEYGVEDLQNIGRYYSAKILAPNGKLVDEVLIDKQCGAITSLRRKVE
jgi:hypothetical protein